MVYRKANMTSQEVSLERRATEVQRAEEYAEQVAEEWLTKRTLGGVPKPLDEKFVRAMDDLRSAQHRYDKTNRRLHKDGTQGLDEALHRGASPRKVQADHR
jgi:hypothetical protein